MITPRVDSGTCAALFSVPCGISDRCTTSGSPVLALRTSDAMAVAVSGSMFTAVAGMSS